MHADGRRRRIAAIPMPSSQTRTPGTDAPSPRRDLMTRLEEALDQGVISPADVEGLLARRPPPSAASARPAVAMVLYAVGGVVVFGGLALAYATIFGDLPRALRMTTPFLFPLAALAVCLLLRRRDAPVWQVELAGLVTYIALAGACIAAGGASQWLGTDRDVALAVAVGSALAVPFAVALWRALGSLRLLVLGLGATLTALGVSLAELAGVLREGTLSRVFLAEAIVAVVVALALARRSPGACRLVSLWAMLGVWASSIAGVSAANPEQLSIWHVTLAAGVVVAFLAAASMSFNGLLWLAALAGLQWLQAIAIVVGSATSAAFALVLTGLGLLGLGLLVTRLNRRIRLPG
jgi:hypothetical protein